MNHIKSLLLIFLCAVQLNAAPTEVIIPITENSTVADLFTYVGADGKKHISFPLSPHFKSYWPKEYPAFYKKGLTLQSFLQFISQGHTLFEDPYEQQAFYAAIKAVIPLLKISDFKRINNLSTLHETQKKNTRRRKNNYRPLGIVKIIRR
ncbi:hypothetical protein FJ366_04050 [Candidatus Dependentiae bacterium]|nr:hypothetical protein [Candidatus Dependentiae bacterium]